MSVAEDLHNAAIEVERVLREYPATRESDQLLAWCVYQQFYGIGETITKSQFLDILPSFETIRRTRQKIQNDLGKYLPKDPVVRRRRGLEDEWKDALQYDMFPDLHG